MACADAYSMSYQSLLLKLFSASVLRGLGEKFLLDRAWTIEGGKGAGLRLRLPQNRDYISGQSEIPVQEELACRLNAGDVFYDVGANVGFFSLIAASYVGPTGCVYAFEPVEANVASIRENARLNNLNNVTLFALAVGRTSGIAELLLTEWDGGGSLSTSAVKPPVPIARRNVRVVALDDLIKEERLRLPNFVKIDVEGVELDVLIGMSETIAKARPVLLFEVDDGNKASFERRQRELDDYVAALGYEVFHLEPSYPNLEWNVGHSLALPQAIQVSSSYSNNNQGI